MKQLVCAAIASLVFPILALAADAPADSKHVRPWLGVSGGFNTYSMGDVNDEIDAINAEISPLVMDNIKDGLGVGVQVGIDPSPSYGFAIGYQRFFASSSVGDDSGTLKYSLPANAFLGTARYLFPSERPFKLGVAGSVGVVISDGEVSLEVPGEPSVTGDISGSGPLIDGSLVGEWWNDTERFGLSVSGGYRYAKVGKTKVNDQTILNEDGSNYSLDYSGLVLQASLRVSFASQ